MEPEFIITTTLKHVPEKGGWHYVMVNKDVSEDIKSLSSHLQRGFKSIRVRIHIGKTEWVTSIFPTKSKEYFLPIKALVRKVENLQVGKKIEIKIVII